ncbi:hypothetical protein SKAU_G00066360 [Synaphobranchus kaupii]|uniref:Uncharacterized protein n=1 Tax=Synaphobranchus kaupii TaxID=118154 RepID=A0A9Q1G6U0_SYNKA|nr:hypothetical protein SKAU_G00066360 [Synaphobranchus kaupii]
MGPRPPSNRSWLSPYPNWMENGTSAILHPGSGRRENNCLYDYVTPSQSRSHSGTPPVQGKAYYLITGP